MSANATSLLVDHAASHGAVSFSDGQSSLERMMNEKDNSSGKKKPSSSLEVKPNVADVPEFGP